MRLSQPVDKKILPVPFCSEMQDGLPIRSLIGDAPLGADHETTEENHP